MIQNKLLIPKKIPRTVAQEPKPIKVCRVQCL